ncbi:cytochrome P450 [Fusarium redolens]|uniref:Cytochrome P450 n=1 Tax=Fusarium redolens TaxID=48865 RepID=A0A9P9FVU5_FUSRE|nr:cytochrome P450 [Fusarium redolens]KAH7205163.1 cytochrome P450 [Fusarium redolens]
MLAEADGQDKTTLSISTVQAEAGNLILAGLATTATTLTYLIWAILKQPQLQADLERKTSELGHELTLEKLKNAPLLNSIIEETLRLYGAAPFSLPRGILENKQLICGTEDLIKMCQVALWSHLMAVARYQTFFAA